MQSVASGGLKPRLIEQYKREILQVRSECVHVCVHVYMCVYKYIHVCMSTSMCICVYEYKYVYMCV